MKPKLMDILACPIDKYYPLKLYVFKGKEEIEEGLIVCPKCNRVYPIMEEIPHMLPDDLRDKDEDVAFLRKWKDKIPKNVLAKAKPFTLPK